VKVSGPTQITHQDHRSPVLVRQSQLFLYSSHPLKGMFADHPAALRSRLEASMVVMRVDDVEYLPRHFHPQTQERRDPNVFLYAS
jgi:hypothetical protein